MAIVINGSGTVTGISVGGLPDDIFDAGTLADNAVGLAQMAGGTDGNIITYDTSGNPAAVATGSSGQVLTSAGADAVPTMATLSAGKVLQVLYIQPTSNSTTTAVTPDNFADTVYTLAITPSATSSKILVTVTFSWQIAGATRSCGAVQLLRGASVITGSGGEIFQARETRGGNETNAIATVTWVDSPNTTSATTYTLQNAVGESGGTSMTCFGNTGGFTGSMVLQEIGA